MEPSFLKKYQPKLFNEFFIDPAYIELMNTLIQMDNLKYSSHWKYRLWKNLASRCYSARIL